MPADDSREFLFIIKNKDINYAYRTWMKIWHTVDKDFALQAGHEGAVRHGMIMIFGHIDLGDLLSRSVVVACWVSYCLSSRSLFSEIVDSTIFSSNDHMLFLCHGNC